METPVFIEVVPLLSLRSTNLSESAPTVLARRGNYSIVLLSNYSCLDVDTQCAFQRGLELHRGGKPLLSINADAARKCLAGRPVYFVGDSTMRYQYMSLAYFLEWGRWPDRCTRAHGERHPESVVRRNDFGNWSSFFAATERLYRGHMLCDCQHSSEGQILPSQTQTCYRGKVEARLYAHAGVNVSFEWAVAGCAKYGTNLCSWHCWHCWARAESRAAVLMLNAGIHSGFTVHPRHPAGCYDSFINDAAAFFTNGGVRQPGADHGNLTMAVHGLQGVWRMTDWPAGFPHNDNRGQSLPDIYLSKHTLKTSSTLAAAESRAEAAVATRHGMSILEFGLLGGLLREAIRSANISQTAVMWDEYHFEPVMYEFLNRLFLEIICGF